MNSRDRVLSVFEGSRRTWPLDIGACLVTGISGELNQSLQPRVIGVGKTTWADEIVDLAHPALQAIKALQSDVARVGLIYIRSPLHEDEERKDRFGVTWLNLDGQPVPTQHPLESLSAEEILRYPKPDPRLALVTGSQPGEDRALMCDCPVPGIFELSCRLRGYLRIHQDLADDLRIACAVFDYALGICIAWYENVLQRLTVAPDLILLADDLGFQHGLAISPDLYRTVIKPRQRDLISSIRQHTTARIVFHSCGAISSILMDLCDLGIDALHIQPSANKMSPAILRQMIPRDLVLYGMLDMATWLPTLSSDDQNVPESLLRYLETCWPIIAGPTDLMPCDAEPRVVMSGLTRLQSASRLLESSAEPFSTRTANEGQKIGRLSVS